VLCNDLNLREWLKPQETVSKKGAIFGRYLNSVPSEFKFGISPLYRKLIVPGAFNEYGKGSVEGFTVNVSAGFFVCLDGPRNQQRSSVQLAGVQVRSRTRYTPNINLE
jgi:hypothetical protein